MYDDFLSVLDLIKNQDKYAAAVAELVARNQSIQDSIVQLNVVGDIDKAQKSAAFKNAQADQALLDAQVQANKIIADAQKAYDSKFADIQAREVVADQALANYNTIKNQLTGRENDLRQAEKLVEQQRVALDKALADTAAKQVELDARLDKLRQVMG